jgi:HSP20 family molecular chaperone IbpA
MPGVEKGNVDVRVDDGVLFVEVASIWPSTEDFSRSIPNICRGTKCILPN